MIIKRNGEVTTNFKPCDMIFFISSAENTTILDEDDQYIKLALEYYISDNEVAIDIYEIIGEE